MFLRNAWKLSFCRNTEHFSSISGLKKALFSSIMFFTAVPVAKRPRITITNAQKKGLRAWYHTPSQKKTLVDASTWWYSQYGHHLSSLTTSDILSVKNSHLDSDQANLKAKNSRTSVGSTHCDPSALFILGVHIVHVIINHTGSISSTVCRYMSAHGVRRDNLLKSPPKLH